MELDITGKIDNNKAVVVKFFPRLIPFPLEKSQRLGFLMGNVLSGNANPEEKTEFRNLGMEKVEDMLIYRMGIEDWLRIEEHPE